MLFTKLTTNAMYLLLVFLYFKFTTAANTSLLQEKQLVTLHKWTNLTLSFPTTINVTKLIKSGQYNSSKLLPVDVDIEYDDNGQHRTFLTIPRLSTGVPYSLAVVAATDTQTVLNPQLIAYPNYEHWHAHSGTNCSFGITSAMRTFIDDCWRLWVVDSGQINSVQYCAPQILAFDLVNDELLHRYRFKPNLYTPSVSVFTALTVDAGDSENACKDTKVYIADTWGYGLIVYDLLSGLSWRVEHEFMRPDKDLQKLHGTNHGIFTVSITPQTLNAERFLYFHALSSYKEIYVPLHIVNNATLWLNNNNNNNNLYQTTSATNSYFRVLGNRGSTCEAETMDKSGNLFCSIIELNALISWKYDSATYSGDEIKVAAYNRQQIKFVTGLKINLNSMDEEEIWALSNNPMLFTGGPLLPNDVKFQIVGCQTKVLLSQKDNCVVQAVAGKYENVLDVQ